MNCCHFWVFPKITDTGLYCLAFAMHSFVHVFELQYLLMFRLQHVQPSTRSLPSCFWHYLVKWNHVLTLFLFRQTKSEIQVLCHMKPHLACVSLEEHAKQLELSPSHYNMKRLFFVSWRKLAQLSRSLGSVIYWNLFSSTIAHLYLLIKYQSFLCLFSDIVPFSCQFVLKM